MQAAELVLQVADVDGDGGARDALDRALLVGLGPPSAGLVGGGGQVVRGCAGLLLLVLRNAHLRHLVVVHFVDDEALAVADDDLGVWVGPVTLRFLILVVRVLGLVCRWLV